MKRRFLLLAIVSILTIFAFVSCSNNVAPEDKLGKITFSNDSRAIKFDVENSDEVEDLYWYYTAVKADDGFTGGEQKTLKLVETSTSNKDNDDGKKGLKGKSLNDDGFSYGYWNIELKGYAAETDVNSNGTEVNKPKLTATLSNLLVQGENTYATANIEIGEGATTTIEFGDIYFSISTEDANITSDSIFALTVTDNSTISVKVPETYTDGNDSKKNPSISVTNNTATVTFKGLSYPKSGDEIVGDHTMQFTLVQTLKKDGSATDTKVEAANYTLKFGVTKGTKTAIHDDMSKNTDVSNIIINDTERVQSLTAITIPYVLPVETVESDSVATMATATVSEDKEVSYGGVTVKYPKGTIVSSTSATYDSTSSTSGVKIGLEYQGDKLPTESDDEKTTITLAGANTSQCYELTIGVDESNDQLVEVSIPVAKDYNLTTVYHKSVKLPKDKENNDDDGEYYKLNTTQDDKNVLTLFLKSASPIYLIAEKPVASDGETEYYSLSDAFSGVTENGTLTLLNNVTLTGGITKSRSFTLDMDNKVITVSGDAAIEVGAGKALTIKNASAGQTGGFISGIETSEASGIDGIYYSSFDDAVYYANDGDVITFWKNVKINENQQITYGKSFTIDLNQKTLELGKCLNFGYTASYGNTVVNETIKNGTVSVDNYGYIRFEVGSGGTFENVVFNSSDNKFNNAIQIYAKQNQGVNTYMFEKCTFTDTYLLFEGGSYDMV